MNKLKKYIIIAVFIIIVTIIIIVDVISNMGITINEIQNNQNISDNNTINEIKIEQKEKVNDLKIKNLVQAYSVKYFELLNAYYGEENTYSEIYTKEQIKQILYDQTLKQEGNNIDNFMNNLIIKEKAEYIQEDEEIYNEEQYGNITKYTYTIYAGLENSEGVINLKTMIYVDKETNAYLVYFINSMDNKNSEDPKIETIEKNSNNEFEK